MQEPSYLGKTVLVSMWFRMVLTQILTRVQKDFPALTCPQISIFDWYHNFDTHG